MKAGAGETILGRILETTREDVRRRRGEPGAARLGEMIAARERRPGAFTHALARPAIGVIAEHKRRSPSAGELREGAPVEEIVGAYERGGAAALSILTEERHFDGSLEDLGAARQASPLPILRKDFIVDAHQLDEAAAWGADAVLLIVAALEPSELAMLDGRARELGLDTLVEVHDRSELEVALALEEAVVGINNRDLRDFSVDVGRTHELLEAIPDGRLVVSESGIRSRDQLDELEQAGVAAVLVGEALMRAADPEAALRALTTR